MARTQVPEEAQRVERVTGSGDTLKEITPRPKAVVRTEGKDSSNDGLANMYWWDPNGSGSEANGTTKISSNVSGYTSGEVNDGVWRRMIVPSAEIPDANSGAQGVSGAVQYSDGDGSFVGNASYLYVSDSTGEVGVGTATPNGTLDVRGDIVSDTSIIWDNSESEIPASVVAGVPTAGDGLTNNSGSFDVRLDIDEDGGDVIKAYILNIGTGLNVVDNSTSNKVTIEHDNINGPGSTSGSPNFITSVGTTNGHVTSVGTANVRDAFSAAGDLTYDSSTGEFSVSTSSNTTDIDIDDGTTDIATGISNIIFGTDLSVNDSDGTDSSVTINANTSANTTEIDIDNKDSSDNITNVATSVNSLVLGTDLTASDNTAGDGTVTLNANTTSNTNTTEIDVDNKDSSDNISNIATEINNLVFGDNIVPTDNDSTDSQVTINAVSPPSVDIEDGTGSVVVSGASAIEFASDLTVTDDGDGTVTIDANTTTNTTEVDVDNEPTGGGTVTGVESAVNNIIFKNNVSASSVDSSTVKVDSTDTRVDVADGGGTTYQNANSIIFNSNLSVSEDGNGNVTVSGSVTDTRVNIEDSGNGSFTTVTDADAIDFGSNLTASNDGDNSVTVDATDTNTTYTATGNDISIDGSNNITFTNNSGYVTTDTRVNVENTQNGTVTDVSAIDFGTSLSANDDGDGTVTVNATSSGPNHNIQTSAPSSGAGSDGDIWFIV